jgi:hypothetical protein
MDRPMMGPAQQGQIGQIGRATMEPVPQMMRLTPGQRPRTARGTHNHRHEQPGRCVARQFFKLLERHDRPAVEVVKVM